jgi:fatty acid desaturase
VDTLRRLSGVFWLVCLGIVTLYVFFLALGAFSVGELVVVTIIVAALIVLCFIHFIRVRHHIEEHIELRRKVNAFRERRGF